MINSNNNVRLSGSRPICAIIVIIVVISSSLLGTHHCDQSPVPPTRPTPSAQSIKVAALATKLDHWLQCSRMNLLLARQQSFEIAAAAAKHDPSVGGHETNDAKQTEAQLSSSSTEEQHKHQYQYQYQYQYQKNDRTSEQQVLHHLDHSTRRPPALCPPHFDGHLCWPQAGAGQQIQLPCPKIDYLPAAAPLDDERQSSTQTQSQTTNPNSKSNQQQQQQQLSSPPLAAALDAPTGGDLNQSQEITLANLQSITPTGSRAGISPIGAMNQPVEMIRQDGILRTASPTSTSTTTTTAIATDGNNDSSKQPNQGAGEQLKYASRLCENTTVQADVAQWQAQADYSQCQADPADQWVKLDDNESPDSRLFLNLTEQLERVEISIDPYSERALLEQWTYCIGEVMQRQLQEQQQQHQQQSNPPGFCPIIFDGWRCWPATRAGEIAYVNCPSNQPGFSAERKAYKICTLEADWYRHPETNRYWSNYTTCVDTVDLAFRTKILNLYVIGNLISLIALTVSLIIFVSFKSLKCTRVTIHKNLFLSFITNNLMWIIWYTYVVNDADLLRSNPLGCRVWHILLHYFLVSNYFWMFCEGLYLHTILVVAFVSEDKILKWFYLLGWLTPIPIIVTYAYNRSYDAYHTNFCWMEESPYNIILMSPIGISLLLNLVFLINIVRVLVTKLRANNSPDTHQTRKAVRATLILIPLLGLHYMLMPFRPEAKSEWEMIYEIIAAVCTSFQGLCVAMLFCFCNGEVINVIKKKLKDTFLFKRQGKRAMRSRSNTTISNVFNNNNSSMMASSNHNNNNGNSSFHNNNNYNHLSQLQQHHHFEHVNSPRSLSMASVVVPQTGNGKVVLNQLQRQPLMMAESEHNKPTVVVVPGAVDMALLTTRSNGNGSSASQRSSVLTTTTTNVSPVLQQFQKQQLPVSTPNRDQTKLTINFGRVAIDPADEAPHLADEIALEETVRLLQQAESNNNNNHNHNHRDEATA